MPDGYESAVPCTTQDNCHAMRTAIRGNRYNNNNSSSKYTTTPHHCQPLPTTLHGQYTALAFYICCGIAAVSQTH
jgi:hypothetical protein